MIIHDLAQSLHAAEILNLSLVHEKHSVGVDFEYIFHTVFDHQYGHALIGEAAH